MASNPLVDDDGDIETLFIKNVRNTLKLRGSLLKTLSNMESIQSDVDEIVHSHAKRKSIGSIEETQRRDDTERLREVLAARDQELIIERKRVAELQGAIKALTEKATTLEQKIRSTKSINFAESPQFVPAPQKPFADVSALQLVEEEIDDRDDVAEAAALFEEFVRQEQERGGRKSSECIDTLEHEIQPIVEPAVLESEEFRENVLQNAALALQSLKLQSEEFDVSPSGLAHLDSDNVGPPATIRIEVPVDLTCLVSDDQQEVCIEPEVPSSGNLLDTLSQIFDKYAASDMLNLENLKKALGLCVKNGFLTREQADEKFDHLDITDVYFGPFVWLVTDKNESSLEDFKWSFDTFPKVGGEIPLMLFTSTVEDFISQAKLQEVLTVVDRQGKGRVSFSEFVQASRLPSISGTKLEPYSRPKPTSRLHRIANSSRLASQLTPASLANKVVVRPKAPSTATKPAASPKAPFRSLHAPKSPSTSKRELNSLEEMSAITPPSPPTIQHTASTKALTDALAGIGKEELSERIVVKKKPPPEPVVAPTTKAKPAGSGQASSGRRKPLR